MINGLLEDLQAPCRLEQLVYLVLRIERGSVHDLILDDPV